LVPSCANPHTRLRAAADEDQGGLSDVSQHSAQREQSGPFFATIKADGPMGEPKLITALLGFGVFILWVLFQLWQAKRGYLGKGVKKYFDDSDHKKP
jgi:hypothetical protein